MTLLALGNGSPDVFTMIASRSDKILVGMNALLGGVLIASTIVVGSIILNVEEPLHVHKGDFVRDILFLMTALTIMTVTVIFNSNIAIASAILLICYVIYIGLVFLRGDSLHLHYDPLQYDLCSPRSPHSDCSTGGTDAHGARLCLTQIDTIHSFIEYPVRVLQHCTIPLLDETVTDCELWHKYRWTYPVLVPALLAVWLATSEFGSSLQIYLSITLCVVLAILLAIAVKYLPVPIEMYTESLENCAPVHSETTLMRRISLYLWLLVAFCSCIMWIDLTANALVAALSLLGDRVGIPKEFLGLTVLAWGNSIGDCITNNALARQGRGLMALSGCYGGPLFNILIGLGVALLLNSCEGSNTIFPDSGQDIAYSLWQAEYPQQSLLMSVVFLYVVLLSSVMIVHTCEYKLSIGFGIYLIVIYAVYSVCQCTLLYTVEYK